MSVTAGISNISRGSLHDGPGVRTVIYFKGCALRCRWCHNPEALSFNKEILFTPSKCIQCGLCAQICPEHHICKEDGVHFVRDGCTACGRCAEMCPALALNLCGEDIDTEELMSTIKKDLSYYTASGGGVTFSGGECLLQWEAVKELATSCHALNIHTTVESALFVPWNNIEQLLDHIDLFYADLKLADPEQHRRFTGQDNRLILENLQLLSERHHNVTVRIPLIPGVNDSAEELNAIGRILRRLGSGVKNVELLKYNILGASKYPAVGLEYTAFAPAAQSDEEMKKACGLLEEVCGLSCSF